MKILHTADWHVGRTIRGRSRHDEQRAVLGEIVDLARSESVDLVVVAGDQFDTSAPGADAERLVYRTLLDLAEVAPVVMVAGNHDHPGRLEAVSPLLELGRVSVASELAGPDDGGVVRPVGSDARVALIPFVSQRKIVTADHLMSDTSDVHSGRYADRMTFVIERLCQEMHADEVNIVVGHVMVHGASTSTSERSAHTVFDYSIPAQAFPPQLGYVALGHLHRHQRVAASAPVWYSGSPLQMDFGETDERKGVVVVGIEPGLPADVQFHSLNSGRRLVLVSGTFAEVEAAAATLGEDDYVKVMIDEEATAGLAEAVREIVPQAVDVVIDPRRRESFVAAPSDRTGKSHEELFLDYLSESDARDDRVLALFAELLEEAHEA